MAETVVKNAFRLFLAGVLLGKIGRYFLFLTTHIVTPGTKLHKLLLLETAQDLRGSKQRDGIIFFVYSKNYTPFPAGDKAAPPACLKKVARSLSLFQVIP